MNAFTNKDIPLDSLIWGKRTDKAKRNARISYFLHNLHVKPYIVDEPDSFVNMSGCLLGKVFTTKNKWSDVKKALKEAGIVEDDNTCVWGSKCIGYRISEKYRYGDWRVEEIPFNQPDTDYEGTLPHVTLDIEAAHKALLEAIPVRNTERLENGELPWSEAYIDVVRYSVDNFSQGYRVGKTDRIFTAGNLLPRELRKAVLINGRESAEVDLVSSQPLLLATLIQDPKEKAAYLDLVESGLFYENLMGFTKLSRGKTKEMFFSWLFGMKRQKVLPVDNWFRKNFPAMYAYLKALRKEKGHKELSYILQRLEAQVIRHAVSMPHLSVHDSVVVEKHLANKAKDEMTAAIKSLGLNPKFTIK